MIGREKEPPYKRPPLLFIFLKIILNLIITKLYRYIGLSICIDLHARGRR